MAPPCLRKPRNAVTGAQHSVGKADISSVAVQRGTLGGAFACFGFLADCTIRAGAIAHRLSTARKLPEAEGSPADVMAIIEKMKTESIADGDINGAHELGDILKRFKKEEPHEQA